MLRTATSSWCPGCSRRSCSRGTRAAFCWKPCRDGTWSKAPARRTHDSCYRLPASDGMAEEHVVRLLLVDFPVHFLALLDVFVEEDPFGLAFAEHLRMADSTVLCRGQGVERPVRTEMVTDRAVQRSILEMRLMAELHGLILSAEQKFRENPPAKHERNDKTDDERCGTEFKSFCQTAGLSWEGALFCLSSYPSPLEMVVLLKTIRLLAATRHATGKPSLAPLPTGERTRFFTVIMV